MTERKENKYDNLLQASALLFVDKQQASSTYIMLKFRIGFARAFRIMDQLAELKVISKGESPSKIYTLSIKSTEEFFNLVDGIDLGEQLLYSEYWDNDF